MWLVTFFISHLNLLSLLPLTGLRKEGEGKERKARPGFIGLALIFFGVSFPQSKQLWKASCGHFVFLILLLASE